MLFVPIGVGLFLVERFFEESPTGVFRQCRLLVGRGFAALLLQLPEQFERCDVGVELGRVPVGGQRLTGRDHEIALVGR